MRKWLPLIAICLGSFMLLIDVTIVNVALPDMATNLHTTFSSLQWVLDGYALVLAALLMGVGGFADLVGHRRVYVAGLAVFAASSLACGIAPDAGVLVAARFVQGAGAAAMFATTFALLNASYAGKDRGVAYGVWGAVSGAAAAVGPIVGGVLTQALDWRWIFFVNLPLTVVALALTLAVFATDAADRTRRVDAIGTATFTAFAGVVTFALIRANELGWTSGTVIGCLVAGGGALVAFTLSQRYGRHAMLDLALLRNRSFVGVLVAALAVNFAAFAALTYVSIWLQSVLGMSPIGAGLVSLPLSVAAFALSAVVGRRLHGANPGPIIGGGLLLIGAGAVADGLLLHAHAGWTALLPGYVLAGLGTGLAIPTMSSTAMGAVPMNRAGMAAGAVNTARQLSFAIGIAVLGTAFTSRISSYLAGHGTPHAADAARALSGGQAQRLLGTLPAAQRPHVDAVIHAATASGLQATFYGAAVVGVLAGLAALVLIRPARVAAAAAAPGAEPAHAEPATDAGRATDEEPLAV
ncbi:DHA2 family efflux MFS transporter permease subunit [uncultured Jatrophihabitans sp.]|uniref:MFS transporter n=1 Tax=uncultured Jatrophihabitans sp. TaxID=1610747 RepID=UPI0035CC895A